MKFFKDDAARPLLVLLLILLTIGERNAAAHGGGTLRLNNEDIGPYWVSVWTAPEPVREGELHVTIAVAEPGERAGQQAGAPVLGASVEVTVSPRAGGLADISARATNEQAANRLYYEADLSLPVAGDWLVLVEVQGPDGRGEAQFVLPVEAAGGSNWLWIGAIALLVVAAFYLYYASRRTRD